MDTKDAKFDVFLDMETGDPDDCITLLVMLTHPCVNLRCVTVFPGCTNQIGFIKGLISTYGGDSNIPIGCYRTDNPKNHLGQNNVKLFGQEVKWKPCPADDLGHKILARTIQKYPEGYLVTGGPLGNLHDLLQNHPDVVLQKVFIQGGFAGAQCVPEDNQLPKFKGKKTCPTFNFNGHVAGAQAMLASTNIKQRFLISKDVCHSVAWDDNLHKLVTHFKSGTLPWWDMLITAMGTYLKKKPEGKLLHDPLAACTMIDQNIIKFCEVTCFRERGEWGSVPCEGTNTFISIGVDEPLFHSVMLDIPLKLLKTQMEEFKISTEKNRPATSQKAGTQPEQGGDQDGDGTKPSPQKRQKPNPPKKGRVQGGNW